MEGSEKAGGSWSSSSSCWAWTNNNNNGSSSSEVDQMLLPIANVGRIMKQILPENAKVSKEAKETMQECVSEFISFVTGEASDKCRKERRKTLNADDICSALTKLGFDDYALPLHTYLHRYRHFELLHHSQQHHNHHNHNNQDPP